MRCLAVCLAVVLLLGSVSARLPRRDRHTQHELEKRAVIALPIYWGARALLSRLLAGMAAGTLGAAGAAYLQRIKSQNSKPCYNNRGWCRAACFSHEKVKPGYGLLCGGGYRCCVPNN